MEYSFTEPTPRPPRWTSLPHRRRASNALTPMIAAVLVHMMMLAGAPGDAEVARNWPCFRGSAAGIVSGEIPSDFDGPSARNVRWKSPIPLPGNNSPIVWGDRIFLSGATKQRQEVFCFDAETGALR